MMPLYLKKGNIVDTNGYTLKIIPNDKGISTELRVFKTHEPLATELLRKELKDGMVCIDMGSNIGYYAILESKLVGNSGKVIGFEPAPMNFIYLNHNVAANKLSNIETYNTAIGDTDGYVNFLIREQSNSCRVVFSQATNQLDGIATIKVPVKTLDTFIQERQITKVDFIRMDLDGYEYKAYQGMINTIKRFKPALMMEIHPEFMGQDKTLQLLKNLQNDGYEIRHCIDRVLDYSLVGSMKAVKELNLNKFIEMVANRFITNGFTINNAFNVYLDRNNGNPESLGHISEHAAKQRQVIQTD